MVVLSLPALELAVARTLTFSFLGFLVSLLPLFFSLDMGVPFRIEAAKADAGAVVARSVIARQGAWPCEEKAKLVVGVRQGGGRGSVVLDGGA